MKPQRRMAGGVRAMPLRNPGNTTRSVGTTVKAAGRVGGPVLLSILFWYIFYQNLPGNLGLNAIEHVVAAEPDGGGNTLDRIMKIGMILMSLYVILSQWPAARSLAKNFNLGAAAAVLLAGLSATWSIEPAATILRFTTLASIVLITFALSLAGWHRYRFQQLAIPPVMIILIVSLLVGAIFPDRITEIGDDIQRRGSWHGITLTKNQFGMTATLGVIICVNRWLAREGRAPWYVAGALASFLCLVLSRSNTSLFAALVCVFFMVMAMRVPLIKRRYTAHLAIAMAVTLLVYELLVQNLIPGAHTLLVVPIQILTGKDASFSARTDIWDIIKQHIAYRPYLGTGYGAYWIGPVATSPSYIFQYRMYFYPTEAHNGYLDIVNDLGYVGLGCVLVFMILYMRQALQLMQFDRNQAALYLALLFQELVMNMSESEWFARDSTFTLLLLGSACLSRALLEGRRSAQSPVPAVR
jgi:exopolysaccharide production protein ExoQ